MHTASRWHRLCLADSVQPPGTSYLEAVPTTILDCTWPKGGVGTLPKGIPVCSLELDNNCPGLQEGAVLGDVFGSIGSVGSESLQGPQRH